MYANLSGERKTHHRRRRSKSRTKFKSSGTTTHEGGLPGVNKPSRKNHSSTGKGIFPKKKRKYTLGGRIRQVGD